MKIKIIALGKIKEKFIREGIDELLKRLRPYIPIEVIEVNPVEKKDENLIENALTQEGEKILCWKQEQKHHHFHCRIRTAIFTHWRSTGERR